MREDPYVIQLNIKHYIGALKLPCTAEKRQQLQKLLSEAEADLRVALSEIGRATAAAD